MKSIGRFFVAFLAVTGLVALLSVFFGVQFNRYNYWNVHGILFLIFVSFFPRVTLVLSSVPTGGLLWWVGWLVAPRILVAVMATVNYWYQNPVLVVMAWLVAFGGESSEKYVVVRRGQRKRHHGPDGAKWIEAEVIKKD